MSYIDENGILKVLVINEGQGTSAYYKREQLARDGGAFEGGLVFLDHPGRHEEADRPERSLRDLVGPIVGVPQFDENGPEGPGLYGECRVATHWRPFVEELEPAVSIRAGGTAVVEEIDGKRVRVAEKFLPGAGFDLVTKAGRGGKLVPLLEASQSMVDTFMESQAFLESDGSSVEMRFLEWAGTSAQEDSMELKEALARIAELETEVSTLTEAATARETENAQLREAIALREARTFVESKLAESKLHALSVTRLTESLVGQATLTEAGQLDQAALSEAVEAAVVAERGYVEGLGLGSVIHGMGAPAGDDDEAKVKAQLRERQVKRYLTEGATQERAEAMADAFMERG